MNEGSNFFATDQSGANVQSQTNPSIPKCYTAGDAAKSIQASTTTVKRLATELRLDVQQTEGGLWLFTESQVAKIKAEMTRRQAEARR